MKILRLAAFFAALASPLAWAQSSYPNAARDLAANCANCHGTQGRATAGMPVLAGRPRAEIARAMQDFRDGRRAGTLMPQLAKGYTDAQVEAIASYLAAQSTAEGAR